MKRSLVIAAAFSLFASVAPAAEETAAQAKPETYLILRCFDHAKQMSYKLASQSEYKTLVEEAAAETKFWDKAMAAAEKAWKADSATSKKSFPRNAISPKKMQVLESYTDQEKASTKLTNLESALSESEEADRKRAEEQEKKRTETARKMLGDRAMKKKTDTGTSDREALMESARSLFESKLTELSSGVPGGQAPAEVEPPAEKKAVKK